MLSSLIGLLRSLLIYYAIPGRIRRLTQVYDQFVQPGDLVFDVGAHVGNHTLACLRLGARVVAIEPQPLLIRFLRLWYVECSGVFLVEKALAGTPDQGILLISSLTPTVSTIASG